MALTRALRFLIFAGIGATVFSQEPARSARSEQVRVEPSIAWSVEGRDDVQRVFGATVNGTNRDQMTDEIRAMNLNGARAYLWPYGWWKHPDFTPSPLTPWAASQYGGKPLSREESFEAWDRFFGQDFDTLIEEWWNDAYPKSPMVYQLDLFKNWGLDDGIILHTQVDGSGDRHPDDVYRYYHAYLSCLQKHYPMLHFQFVQLTNEPNYSWWSGQFATTQESVDTWIRVFNRLDARLAANKSGTQLLGPCLASSEFFSWGGWRNWTVPILHRVDRPMHYFNYHLYDTPAFSNLAWLEMLQADADTVGRPRPQGIVTEMQYRLGDGSTGAWQERCRWWAEQFFMALAHPDKVYEFDNFLLAYLGKSDVFVATNGRYQPTDLYWVYWTLANTRGKTLYVVPSADSAVQSFACAPSADKLTVSLFNPGKAPVQITVNPGLPSNAQVQSVHRRFAQYAGSVMTHDELTLPAIGSPVVVNIEPGGVTSVVWQLARPLPSPARTLTEREYYSPVVSKSFSSDLAVTIKTKRLPVGNETTKLRFAVDSNDLLSARGTTIVFNGHSMPVYWNQAPAQTDADTRSTWWMELPLKRGWVKPNNTVVFAAPDASYHLMFASLAIDQHPDAMAASVAETAAMKHRLGGIFASLKPIGSLLEHSGKPFELLVNNQLDAPVRYSVTITLPAQTALEGLPLSQTVVVSAHANRVLHGTLRAGTVRQVADDKLVATVTPATGMSQTLTSSVSLFPNRCAVHAEAAPKIDGDLSKWAKTPPVVYSRPGLTAKTRLSWDSVNLYVAVDVRGKFRPQRPDTVNNFWGKDAIELFVDLDNSKNLQYNEHDWQLYLCPVGIGDDHPFGGEVQRKRQGDDVNIVDTAVDPAFRIASIVADDGYTIEAAIPWGSLSKTFTPRPGAQIGFDIAIDHMRGADGLSVSDSIFGLPVKAFMSPNKWGVLTLLAPNTMPAAPAPITIAPDSPEAVSPKQTTFGPLNTDGWDLPRNALLDQQGIHLANLGGGSNLLMREPVPALSADGGVSTSITVAGFEKHPPPDGTTAPVGFRTHMRAYWTPKLPSGFIDPWCLSDAIWLMGSETGDGLELSLWRKIGEGAGNGIMLWSGVPISLTKPLTARLWLDRNDYRISFDAPVETATGAVSGKHGLPPDLWSQPVRFGVKSCYGTQPADLILSKIVVQAGKPASSTN